MVRYFSLSGVLHPELTHFYSIGSSLPLSKHQSSIPIQAICPVVQAEFFLSLDKANTTQYHATGSLDLNLENMFQPGLYLRLGTVFLFSLCA